MNGDSDSILPQNAIDCEQICINAALNCGCNKAAYTKLTLLVQNAVNAGSLDRAVEYMKLMLFNINTASTLNECLLEELRQKDDLSEQINDTLCEAETIVENSWITRRQCYDEDDASSMSFASPLLNNQQRQQTTQISMEDVSTEPGGTLDEVTNLRGIDHRRRERELSNDKNGYGDAAIEEEGCLDSSMSVASSLLNNRRRKRTATQIRIEDVLSERGTLDEADARRRRGEHDKLSKGDNPRSSQLRRRSMSLTNEDTFKEEATAEAKLVLQKFITINCGKDEPKPIATSTRLVPACKLKLLEVFTREGFSISNIHLLLESLRCVLEGVDTCRKQFVNMKEKEATLLGSMPNYSDENQSRGALLKSLQKGADVNYQFVLDRIAEESDIGQAIQDCCKLTKSAVEAFSIYSQPVQTLFIILAHLAAAVDVLTEFTVQDLFAHLSHDLTDYIEFSRLSANLYRRQVGRELGIGSVTLLGLIEDVIVPFLRKDALEDKMSAVKLALIIKKHVTNIGNGQGERKRLVLEKFGAAAARPVKDIEEVVDVGSSQLDYFDNPRNRAGTMVAFFILLLTNEIESKSNGAFRGRGFGRRILDLSWSDLTRRCNRFLGTSKPFFDTSSVEAFGKFSAESDFKDFKSGSEEKEARTNVIIFNRQQMNSLHAILHFDSE